MRPYSEDDPPIPVTAIEAAKRLGKSPATIRKWAQRYNADQMHRIGHAIYYDFRDLCTIEKCIFLGLEMPMTPAERDLLRPETVRALAS